MPLDLTHLHARCAELGVDYAGEVVRFYYRPQNVTGQTQRVVAQSGADPDPVFKELERVLIAWDITDGGQPIPINAEGFGKLPFGLSLAILRAILDDVRNPTWVAGPAPGSLTPWSNGSSPTERSAALASPSTSSSSSPPNGPTSPPGTWQDSTTRAVVSAGTPGSAERDER